MAEVVYSLQFVYHRFGPPPAMTLTLVPVIVDHAPGTAQPFDQGVSLPHRDNLVVRPVQQEQRRGDLIGNGERVSARDSGQRLRAAAR